MKLKTGWQHVWVRNGLALMLLLLVHYIPDRLSWKQRSELGKIVPYLMLVLMYGWMVFHNRILFGQLYLGGKKRAYFFWTILLMIFNSLMMHFILVKGFHQTDTIPQILSFWIFTVTGLGVYVIFLYLQMHRQAKPTPELAAIPENFHPTHFNCMVDGVEKQIPLAQLVYVESLENYVKINTPQKTYLVRLSMKEAEIKLPKPGFLRISRQHIVNTALIASNDQQQVQIGSKFFKIGKVYKRYVEEQLAAIAPVS